MYLIGQDHTPTNVIEGVQCAVHRVSIDVDVSEPDNVLRHIIYTQNMPRDVFRIYPHGGVSLKEFLDRCQHLNVVPMVNVNFGRQIWDVNKRPDLWKAKYTLAQWRRLSRLVAELITRQYNFSKQFLLVFNEPLKWLDRHEVGLYTRATNQGIGTMREELPIVIGNDEYDLSAHHGNAYHYWCVHFLQDFDYIGAHPLSSIMNDAYWKIDAWRELADQFEKPIMATEAGSWEHRYTTPQGHDRNKRIILRCKQQGYLCCNIVLIDCNDSYPSLGYRRWDRNYTRITDVPLIRPGLTYFQDFLHFIMEHGITEQEEILMEYLRPQAQQAFYEAMGWDDRPYHNNTPNLPIVGRKDDQAAVRWADFDAVFESLLKGLVQALIKSGSLPEDFPRPMNIKYNEDGSWNADWKTVAESNPK